MSEPNRLDNSWTQYPGAALSQLVYLPTLLAAPSVRKLARLLLPPPAAAAAAAESRRWKNPAAPAAT